MGGSGGGADVRVQGSRDREADEIVTGLCARVPWIAPKYFYDGLGSALFGAICELDEYYPTRTERGILDEAANSIAGSVGKASVLVDLGAGDCAKARRLIPVLEPATYVPVDISIEFVRASAAAVATEFPGLRVFPVGCDFTGAWRLPEQVPVRRRVFFYPGSSIGNFDPDAAVRFLAGVRELGGQDGSLLIGVDLVKDRATLERAYDDVIGVTAAFNRNVLRHVNRLVGADFDPAQWRHVAHYAVGEQRIEMHLEACGDQLVRWRGGSRLFAAGERIHTESSYKYEVDGFARLLGEAGWQVSGCWTDPDRWFAVYLARGG